MFTEADAVVLSQCCSGLSVNVAVGPGVGGSVIVAVTGAGDCHSTTGMNGGVAPLALSTAEAPPNPGNAPGGEAAKVRFPTGVTRNRSLPTNWRMAVSPVPGTTTGGSDPSGAAKSPEAEISEK